MRLIYSLSRFLKPCSRQAQCVCQKSNGFTLLEVMVALSVFSLAALSLIKLQAYTIQSASDIDQNTMARIVLQNIAVDIMTDPNTPALGDSGGNIRNGGQEWQWQQNVQTTGNPDIIRVDIVVSGQNAPSPQILTIVRPLNL